MNCQSDEKRMREVEQERYTMHNVINLKAEDIYS